MGINFVSHGAPLDDGGLSAALDALQVGAAQLWAVLHVETGGVGYLSDRRPDILFERHIFSRLTYGQFDGTNPDVSNRQPGGYGAGGAHQYDRLDAAMALDSSAALKSASWGIGQTMGFNYQEAGCANVEDMVARMVQSESDQLMCAAGEILEGGAVAALRARDWTNFARIYNGPNYAQNNYDSRLSAAYQGYAYGGTPDLRVRAVQYYLEYLGFHPGPVDGVSGQLTRSALHEFQASRQLPITDVVDDSILGEMRAAADAL